MSRSGTGVVCKDPNPTSNQLPLLQPHRLALIHMMLLEEQTLLLLLLLLLNVIAGETG